MIELNTIITADALEGLKQLPAESVNMCVTSPPYWGLRDYGVAGQIGLEPTLDEYIEKIVQIFREVKQVLRKDGTLWLNLGDSYASAGQGRGGSYGKDRPEWEQCKGKRMLRGSGRWGGGHNRVKNLKPKDQIGIPWEIAFALRADGWWLRQDIIWNKSNPMPESVQDRCTKAHEYIFLLSKSRKYYYDAYAIAEDYKDKTLTTFGNKVKGYGDESGLIKSENWSNDIQVRKPKEWKTPDGWDTGKGSYGNFHKDGREKGIKGYDHKKDKTGGLVGHSGNFNSNGKLIGNGKANKRSVWTAATQPFSDAHFATFPEALIEPCILAGCPAGGIVLDPFMGAGTTALVAIKHDRNFIGIELNPEYVKIANKRIEPYLLQQKFNFG